MTSPRVLFAVEVSKLKQEIESFSKMIRRRRALRLMYQGILKSFRSVECPSKHDRDTIKEYQQKLIDLPPILKKEQELNQLHFELDLMFWS